MLKFFYTVVAFVFQLVLACVQAYTCEKWHAFSEGGHFDVWSRPMSAAIIAFPQSDPTDELVCLNPGVAADLHRFLTLLETCAKNGHPTLHGLDKGDFAQLAQIRNACGRQYKKMTE